jgi:hypothetical protein
VATTQEAQKVSVAEFRARAVGIVDLLDAAREAVDSAKAEAESLLQFVDGRDGNFESFPRFEFEISKYLQSMVQDLGGDDGLDGYRGEFDVDRMPIDARNLVDLIDLASTAREAVTA